MVFEWNDSLLLNSLNIFYSFRTLIPSIDRLEVITAIGAGMFRYWCWSATDRTHRLERGRRYSWRFSLCVACLISVVESRRFWILRAIGSLDRGVSRSSLLCFRQWSRDSSPSDFVSLDFPSRSNYYSYDCFLFFHLLENSHSCYCYYYWCLYCYNCSLRRYCWSHQLPRRQWISPPLLQLRLRLSRVLQLKGMVRI